MMANFLKALKDENVLCKVRATHYDNVCLLLILFCIVNQICVFAL